MNRGFVTSKWRNIEKSGSLVLQYETSDTGGTIINSHCHQHVKTRRFVLCGVLRPTWSTVLDGKPTEPDSDTDRVGRKEVSLVFCGLVRLTSSGRDEDSLL